MYTYYNLIHHINLLYYLHLFYTIYNNLYQLSFLCKAQSLLQVFQSTVLLLHYFKILFEVDCCIFLTPVLFDHVASCLTGLHIFCTWLLLIFLNLLFEYHFHIHQNLLYLIYLSIFFTVSFNLSNLKFSSILLELP